MEGIAFLKIYLVENGFIFHRSYWSMCKSNNSNERHSHFESPLSFLLIF